MKSLPARALLLGGAAALVVALPAASQESPESLLPPGFGDPQNLPPPEEKAPSEQRPQGPSRPSAPSSRPAPRSGDLPQIGETREGELGELEEFERPRPTNYFSIPEGEARPLDLVGVIGPGSFGVAPDAFGNANGGYLASLMRRLDAPLPSRWTSILLRRALMSRLAAPPAIHPVDWVAARADLLLRMGEADAARLLVQSVDREFYTPAMIEAAADTALATSDPAALCPLVGPSGARGTVWKLAEAMCSALEGEPAQAGAHVDEARRRGELANVDILLTEKVMGAGTGARRAASIQWDEVNALTPWRFGLASATGAELPERLVNGASLPIQAWLARAPMVPLEQRLAAASVAASLGVFSSRSLAEVHALMLDQTDAADAGGTVGERLRRAWVADEPAERLEAMRGLWQEGDGPHQRHARLILTAGAAARIAPSEDFAGDVDELVASMLTAGLDRQAARWSAVVESERRQRAWAMLALASPQPAVDLSAGRIESFADADDSAGHRRSQMLVAGLAGLGRLSESDSARLASGLGFGLGGGGRWSAALDNAARARQPGTVLLLAGVGMQTGSWNGVPPAHLFRIVRSLRAVGLEYEARMIAAEAVARL